jgi:hypothetical protein
MLNEADLDAGFQEACEIIKSNVPNIESIFERVGLKDFFLEAADVFYRKGVLDGEIHNFTELKSEFQKEFLPKRCAWCDALLGNTYFTGENNNLYCSEVCGEAAKISKTKKCSDVVDSEKEEAVQSNSDWPDILI